MTLYYTLVSTLLSSIREFRWCLYLYPASFHPMRFLPYGCKLDIAGGSRGDHDVTNTGLTISTGVFSPPRGDGGFHVPHPSATIHMAQGCFHLHI